MRRQPNTVWLTFAAALVAVIGFASTSDAQDDPEWKALADWVRGTK